MKRIPIGLLGGIASILTTIVLYYVILQNLFLEIICFMTLIGVVIAEMVTTVLACISKGKPRLVSATMVSGFMIPYAVILSITYITNFPYGYGTYLAWYFVGYAIIAVIVAILFSADSRKQEENQVLQNAKNNMLNMRKIVKCIINDSAADAYKAKLEQIDEKLHYSNDSVIAYEDQRIYDMLINLQQNISDAENNTDKKIEEIIKLIDVRNIMSSRTV